jgi:hypothetical protein
MNDTHADGAAATGDSPVADLLAGATFLALGAGFALGSLRYDIGSALRMGTGYVPLVLGAALAALGLTIIVQGVLARTRSAPGEPAPDEHPGQEHGLERGPVPWVRGALLIAGVVVFGLTVQGLGLAVSLFATTYLAAIAGHRTGPLKAAVVAAGLTVLSLVVFVGLLQLRLPIRGEWLGG